MHAHVQHAARVCYANLRKLWSIRKYLTTEATKTLVQALIMSHLDYSNGLLYGISSHLLAKLQRVQNAAARLVLRKSKYDHITESLKDLHWLPVRFRINYKIAVTTFKVLTTNHPAYLREVLVIHEPKRASDLALNSFWIFLGPNCGVLTVRFLHLPPVSGTHYQKN